MSSIYRIDTSSSPSQPSSTGRNEYDSTPFSEPLLPRYTAQRQPHSEYNPDSDNHHLDTDGHELSSLPLPLPLPSSGQKQSTYEADPTDDPSPNILSSRRRKSSTTHRITKALTYTSIGLLILTLATPLVLLHKEGLLVEGLKSAVNSMCGDGKGKGKRPHANAEAFPTNIGFAGPTPTGLEPALIITAPSLPKFTAQPPLFPPSATPTTSSSKSKSKSKSKSSEFNILQHFGQLSPWFSVDSEDFGLPNAGGVVPEKCEIKGLHWLQRHGARYPTSMPEGPKLVWNRLKSSKTWTGAGPLSFLNDFEYKLGAEVLTPFGRQQLFNLGASARIKYGFLLETFKDHVPVFRTESQDRMLKSAQNFAAGFFGIPAEDQYNLEVTIEGAGFNNTLAPYTTCSNDNGTLQRSVNAKIAQWDRVYLADAAVRLNKHMKGFEISIDDAKDFMEMCAYETVALGYSSFCSLFTETEWKGFQYRLDIMWWYHSSFGSPVARAQGVGWVQELLSRLTHTRITEFNSTTNSTFHNDVHFPLNDAMYIDFTHDTTFAELLPTLNLTQFADGGPLPLDHIPKKRKFISSKFCPFATHMEFQILSCDNEDYIRLLLNDGVVALTGLEGCPEDEQGKCPLSGFIDSVRKIVGGIDFQRECNGEGVDVERMTVNGSPVW